MPKPTTNAINIMIFLFLKTLTNERFKLDIPNIWNNSEIANVVNAIV